MAITFRSRVGKTRIKLASLLEKILPGVKFDPADLESQNPYYCSEKEDCCTWMGSGTRVIQGDTYVYSWNRMKDCVRHGISVERDSDAVGRYEVFSEE